MSNLKVQVANKSLEEKRKELLEIFAETDIEILPGKRKPKNGRYSGIIGTTKKSVSLNN